MVRNRAPQVQVRDGLGSVISFDYLEPVISLRRMGALPGDETTNADANADVLQAATAEAISTGKPILIDDFFQIGVRSTGTNRSFITPIFTNGCRLRLIGAGTLKEKDGKTASVGRFNKMFFFNIPAGVTVEEIYFAPGLTLDKNGRASFPTGQANGATGFDWEQSHTINIVVNGTGSINRLEINGVTFRDKTASHVVIGGSGLNGPVRQGAIRDCSFVNPDGGLEYLGATYGFSQRGCVECQGVANLAVVNCRGRYIQTEPNAGGYTAANRTTVTLDGGEWITIDFAGPAEFASQPYFTIVIRGIRGAVTNFHDLTLDCADSDLTWSTNGWINLLGTVRGSVIRLPSLAGALTSSFYPRISVGGKWNLALSDCEMTLVDAAAGNVTGFAIQGAGAMTATLAKTLRTTFNNCRFDSRFEHIADSYRVSGTLVFNGGKMACHGYGFRVGALSGDAGFLELNQVDCRDVAGVEVSVLSADSVFGLRVTGRYLLAEMTFELASGGTLANIDASTEIVWPTLISDAVPTSGGYFKGMTIEKRLPDASGIPAWRCTAGGVAGSTAVFKAMAVLAA